MAKKVTIYDIAKKLGITPATVSYALNNVPKVSPEMRKKILDTAMKMGYVRNYTAVSLSTGKSKIIALLLPFKDISEAFLQNPFYGEFIGFFEKNIKKEGYDLFIQPLYDEKELELWLVGRGVDAAVVLGTFPDFYEKSFKNHNMPVVLVDVYNADNKDYSSVCIADFEGEFRAAEYLIQNGHKRIAFVGADINNSIVDKRRYDGYRKALADYKIPYDDSLLFKCNPTFADGVEFASKLIKRKDITALVCAADTLAIGIMNGYRMQNKQIPECLSIVGFDDIQSSSLVYPSLTTVKQDIESKASLAAKFLFEKINNPESSIRTVTMELKLIIRDSVSKINQSIRAIYLE